MVANVWGVSDRTKAGKSLPSFLVELINEIAYLVSFLITPLYYR